MLKFFRKYNMLILVVGGCFLMVSFLIGSSIQQLQGMMNNTTVATMRGEKISAKDYQRASVDYSIVKRMLDPVFPEFIAALEGTDGSGVESWLMLSTEAQRLGLVGGVQDGQNMMSLVADIATDRFVAQQLGIPQLSPQMLEIPQVQELYDQVHQGAVQLLEQQRQQIIRGGSSERGVDLALARAHGVMRLFYNYRNDAALVSAPELRAEAQRVLDIAVVGMVTIPARISADGLPEPTEEEIQAQFDQFRDVRPGEGLLGFGYLRPPAVQLAWIGIDHILVGAELELDPIDVRVYHKNNRAQRGWPEDFNEVKAQVEEAMRDERASRIVAAGVEAGRNEMRRISSPLGDDGSFKQVPDNWRDRLASMDEVASKIRKAMNREAGVDVSNAVTVMTTENDEKNPWRSTREAMLLPGIGQSIEPSAGGRGWTSFGELALQVRGLVPDEQARLQEGLIYGPVNGGENRYFFRVTDTRPESPPESLAEVREKVALDARLLQGWNHLNEVVAQEAEQLAEAEGLDAVARKYGMGVQRPIEVSRMGMTPKMTPVQPIRGENQPALRDAIMDRVETWDPLAVVSEMPLAQRVVVMPVEEAKGLVVVVVEGRYPVTKERLLESYSTVENALARQYTEALNDNIFSTARLRERFDYVEVKRRRGGDDAEEEEALGTETPVDPNLETLQ